MPASTERLTIDANEAVARVAYSLSEVVSIFPITPSSPMAEHCDEWAAKGHPNLWGEVPRVVQLQSEGGVAGALHGTLMGGALSTSFTASQGLLLMIPNMYKIAGELTPAVLHVSARALATSALSIFGDHSDVMACRQTGWGMLASNSVQEAHDLAAIAHAATLQSRVPFLHFFDGFRTSHEINEVSPVEAAVLEQILDPRALATFYENAISPDHPSVRGTAHNPDTYFQTREAVNVAYARTPGIVQECMDRFAVLTGRRYRLFDYTGAPDAERVVILMGSGAVTAAQTARHLCEEHGEKVGVLAVRLYRPFDASAFLAALPATARRIAVLDRTKEPGAGAEPLCLDITQALNSPSARRQLNGSAPQVITGGRYGLGSKEFTPAMAKAVFDELKALQPRETFTVGVEDDITHLSLPVEKHFSIESPQTSRAVFFGLGSDGTVGANKNTIKIIGEATDLHAQAFFVYDSKKSGGLTTSHLRFGPDPIEAPYLIGEAQFVACHAFGFLGRVAVLDVAAAGGIFLLNSPHPAREVWDHLPREVQEQIVAKGLRFHVIDAYGLGRELGLGGRINTIMQTAFFALSGLLPEPEAVARIQRAIEKTYASKGPNVVETNCKAVDMTLARLERVEVPSSASAAPSRFIWVPDEAPDFVRRVTASLLAGQGDRLPVSALPPDGVWPTATARYEKRRTATGIPVWNAEACTQCNQCSMVCPHAAIRPKVFDAAGATGAPAGFASLAWNAPAAKAGERYTLQVFPEDCTGCTACVEVCPTTNAEGQRSLVMKPLDEVCENEKEKLAFFQKLPGKGLDAASASSINISLVPPLFEFSGACAGCTQTPYVRLLTQLFGDRLLMANATGCSSIYGGNLPTTPYCTGEDGRGPAWANSLFEDNAEFGLGLHLSAEWRRSVALRLLGELREEIGAALVHDLSEAEVRTADGRERQRARIDALKETLRSIDKPAAKRLLQHADYLVPKSTWIVGGDGWAYDIGFGGLDHVLASGHNVNVLVLDTEVYSNTGGQASKGTPLGAVAKFAAGGKESPKKDLGALAMTYGNIYVGQIALGANPQQTLEVLREAEAYDGPSLILAYGPCAAHGIDLAKGPQRQKDAVETGYWPLYRYDPRHRGNGVPPLRLDSFEPSRPVADFMAQENRFRALQRSDPDRAALLASAAQAQVDARWKQLEAAVAAAEADDEDEDDGWG